MSELELSSGQDTKLAIRTDAEAKVLSVEPLKTPETIGIEGIKKSSTPYFAPAGRVGALFGAVKAEDIEIAKTTSLGPLQNVLKGKLSSVLGSKDAELEKKVELNVSDVLEIATYTYSGKFLFDGNLGVESKEIFDSLKGRDLHPISEVSLKKKGHVLEATYAKEEVMEEVRKRLCKEPEETPRRILEQEFYVSELSLIYLPFYDFTLEHKDKMRTIRLNGMTGEIKEV